MAQVMPASFDGNILNVGAMPGMGGKQRKDLLGMGTSCTYRDCLALLDLKKVKKFYGI